MLNSASESILSILTKLLLYTVCSMCFVVFSAIGRTLIPRYFRSMFEGGVSEFYVLLKHAKESFHNTAIILDCDLATIVTHHNQPVFTKVCRRLTVWKLLN